MLKTVYVILTTSTNERYSQTEITISQEGYDSLEKAQAFCTGRFNVEQVNELVYQQKEENEQGWKYIYSIIPVSVI